MNEYYWTLMNWSSGKGQGKEKIANFVCEYSVPILLMLDFVKESFTSKNTAEVLSFLNVQVRTNLTLS